MAPVAVGDTLPDGTLAHFDEQDQLQQVSIHSLAAGKKVVIVGVPVNDPFVMKAWAKTYPENKHVKFWLMALQHIHMPLALRLT
ncbi:hypothetical protein GH714_039147 [Hevea brasiliensis]|uniref:Glutaredoxin-dependent peroxiredoxin n=1 Tax=Hevea brasiliensis TaxID=3981 RepID=A0A6A6LTV2_HEVBR|nr:hypothetical protein GH714_039147 [Hevea brasiliensis]